MGCEWFGPIRLSDGAQIADWQNSCIAARKIPKWTGPWTASGNNDVMKCYCCDSALDVPSDTLKDVEEDRPRIPAESYLMALPGEVLEPLLAGETVSFELGDGELELAYRPRAEYPR